MIGSPGNDESASSKETRPSRLNDSHSISPNTAITISTINNDYRFEEEEGGSKQSESCLLEPPSPSAPTAGSTPSPPAPSTIQATSSQHEQSIKSLSPPPASGTRSRSMSLVPGLDMLSPILFSGIIGGGHSGPGSTVGETSKPSGPSRERKNSCLTERTPQFMTVAPSFTTRTGPWSHDRLARARQSIDVRSFPSYLARKRQSIIGARLFDTLVEVAGSPLQAITPEGDENEDNRSSTDNNSGKNNDSRGSRKSLIHRLRGNRKSISDEEPEAPTLSLGERVAWLKSKGPEFGTVRWIGRLPKVSASWTVGVEFDNAIGCTDGKFEGRRYFTAKDTFAKFLPLSSLTRVDNIIGRQRSGNGTLLSRMSVQLKPGQLISVQRESENNLPIHCALNAPHHIDHDVHVPNMNHCLCNNCNHPCAHLCKTKKPKGRKTDMAHMCHFSQKPHNKLCCGGEELLYSLASAQDLEMAMNGSPQVGDCPSHGRRRLGSNLSSNTTNNGESTSGAPNGSHRRRSGRSDASRRRSSGSSSTIRRLRDKSRRISSAPTSTERKAESQTKSEGEVGGGNGTGHQGGDNEQEEGEREEEGQVIIGLGKGADCEEGLMSLDSRSNFALCKLKSASELSISSLPSTAASQVEVYIARGALTDESDLDDDDEYGDEEDEEEDNADDDGCSSGLVSSQGRRYLKGSTHGKRSTRNQRRRRRRQLRVGASGNCSRSMTTLTGRSSRSSRRRNSSDGGGTGIGHGGDDDCVRNRRSGKRSGLRSLVSCLVPSIPNSYKKNDKSSKKGKKTKNGQNNRRSKNADNPSKRTLDNNSINCDSPFYHYSHYPCSCDGQSTFTGPIIDPMGPIDSNGHPLVYSLQDQHYLYSSHHHYHHPLHASHNHQQHAADHRHHHYHHQQQHNSSYHHHHHSHRHQQQQNSSKQLAHLNSTNNRQQNHSSSSTHHQHHHHQQQQQQQQQHNCAPQATTCSSSLSRRSRQRKYHGLSTSPEPSPSVSVKNRSSLQHSNLHQHHHYPVEDNLTFGVGVGLAGRASPCGHFYYSPCSVSASQLSIGALQKHLSTTTISKSQATKGKENSQSKHRQPNSPPKDQVDSSTNTNQEQGSKGLQRLVDLDDNLCELTHKTVDNIEILSDLNAKSNCLLTSSPPCSTEKTNLIESALNNTNKDCLINLDSNHSNNLVNNKSANSKSIENNYTNHNNSNNSNNKYNRINNEVNISSKSSNHHSCNGINHGFSPRLYESNSIGSPGFDGRLIGTANNINYQYQQQQYPHEPTSSPSSSTTKTTANGINGENVLTNENNCSYNDNTNYDNDNNSNYDDDNYDYRKNRDEKNEITNDNEMDCNESSMSEQNNHNVNHDSSNSNSNRKLNNFKIEVELTCSPSVQSYTSSSMISPRRKRKGPAPPPPVNRVTSYTSFPSIPGPSGVNVSPFTSPSSSGSSPSTSQPATPLHSTSQGEPSTPSTSSSLLSPSSYPILAPSNSQSSSISSGPSTSTWQSHSTTQSMGRKKSIKTKPAPSPPPPLPPLPPIASASEMQRSSPSKPVKTSTATNKNNDNGASSFVQKSSPRTPLSVNMIPTNCTSNTPSTCQPVIKCLPCRSHSVPVCPMVTLTRSLSDQKQINVKNMLKSVASYSSDLALPQSTVGLIASSRAIQQTLESDSIIITYDEPDYLYPIHHGLTNCYSSCEIPYNISCNTNSPNYIGTNNGSQSLLMVCKEDAKLASNISCKMNDKGLRMRQKSQSFESTSLPTSPLSQKSITDRPPRPPRPPSIVNYKMINRSHPVIPMRTKRRSLVGSTCCTHGCRPDTLTFKERSGSLPLRPRSLPASPISKPYQGSSSTLPTPKSTSSTQSNLTFTRDKTLSGSFSGSTNQGNTGNMNPSHTMCSIGCLTSCSLCSLSGLDGTTSTSTSNPTDQSSHLNYPSKDVHVDHHDDDEDNCSNIYEEIDFTSISENVAALVSPRQLINPTAVNNVSRNHPKDESEKDKIANYLVNCDENNNGNNNVDNGNDMVITCNKEPNVVSIDSTRRLSSSSGPQANNSGGEILSDTSDDRVTVKSVNIKPWAYSTSSLDSEQSTTSSGSTVKQWNNQLIYSSHHHPCHPHHEQHHESQSPNYPHHHHHYDHNHSHHSDALSSPCFHGNYSDFYQGIDHPHPFHHPHSHHHHQAHHLYPYQMTNNHLLNASLDHCHHCPYHHHHHHAPRQMITTSTSDHSLSSLSSNFSEDPATPTPPMMTLDDYTFHSSNFTFTPEDHYLVSPCCPEHLDEQDEDDVINDKKGSMQHSNDKEEEVNVAFKNEVKNGFGLIPCYPQPFYPIPDLVCDEETNEDEDEEDDDDSVGKRFNKMTLKEDKGEQVKEDDEKGKEKKLSVNLKSSSVSSLKNSVKSSWSVKGKDAIPSLSSSPSSAHQPAIFSPFVKPLKDNQLNNSNINCYCHQCFLPHCAKSTFNSTHHNFNHQRKDTFKESPSKMASSWDGSLSGAGGCSSGAGSGAGDDSNESSTHQYHHQSPNGSASINRLMQELQLAISFGQHRKAALLARQLALRKVSCTFNQSPNSTAIDDQPIIVYLYIEDKQSRQGPFPVQLYPSMTVKMLKLKIEGDFGFPVHFQSWILGKCLATNEDNCLSTYGITSSGCPIFLYLLSNSSKSETLSETAQHDDDDDDGEKVDKNGNADEDEEEQDGVDNGLKEIKGAIEMVQQSIPIVGTLTAQNDGEKGKNELAGSLTSKSVNVAIKGPSGSNGPSDSTLLSSEPSTVNEKDIISARKRSKSKVKPSLLLLSNSIATSTSTLTSPSTSTVQSTTMKPTTKIIKSTAHGENRDYRGNTGSRQMNNSTLPVGSLKKHHPKANLKADNGDLISTFDKQSVDSSKLKVKVDSRKVFNSNDKANQGNDENDSGNDQDNDVNKESNDNQMVAQDEKSNDKGQIITTTYKELMALDDVDLVKNFEDFECPVCFINIPSGEGVVLRDCLHMFCRDCLSNAIEFCDEAIVKCPYRSDEYYCDSEITDREIKSLTSPELYQKYLSRSMKAAELRIAKSFHCKTIDCPGWCEFDDNVNTFPCPVCGKVNCLTCQAIHEGINCRQYQDQLDDEAADQNEDAQKTKQFLDNMLDKGEALRCPICFVILIKKWGCDWVKCSMCQSEICWVTKGPRWGPGGKGDVSGGCKCMLNGQKCHPKCNYCH